MKRLFLFLLIASCSFAADPTTPSSPVASRRLRSGTTLPATCRVAEVFFDTDATAGQNVYGCTATNTWTLQGGSATGAGILGPYAIGTTLPTAEAGNTGWIAVVDNGADASDCTVGGGTTAVLCRSNGSAWVALGNGNGTSGSKVFTFVIPGTGVTGVLQDTDDVLTTVWQNELGQGITITGISCETDSATPTRIQLTRRDGSPANILTDNTGAGLDCSSTRASGTIDTNEDNIANDQGIGFTLVTAGGAGKEVSVTVTYTLD